LTLLSKSGASIELEIISRVDVALLYPFTVKLTQHPARVTP